MNMGGGYQDGSGKMATGRVKWAKRLGWALMGQMNFDKMPDARCTYRDGIDFEDEMEM